MINTRYVLKHQKDTFYAIDTYDSLAIFHKDLPHYILHPSGDLFFECRWSMFKIKTVMPVKLHQINRSHNIRYFVFRALDVDIEYTFSDSIIHPLYSDIKSAIKTCNCSNNKTIHQLRTVYNYCDFQLKLIRKLLLYEDKRV